LPRLSVSALASLSSAERSASLTDQAVPNSVHLLFDLLAYALGLACAVFFRRRGRADGPPPIPPRLNAPYFFVLTNGVIVGSLVFGTLNIWMAGIGPAIGKSILGAIVGGIVAVEMFKRYHGIRGSTGAAFVPGLALAIFVGRWGCFFAGIEDFTHGVPSGSLPGVDFGDGIARHPVQLYEGFTMAALFIVAAHGLLTRRQNWWRNGFYYFAIVYGGQRFLWEFIKPYPRLPFGINMFQVLCLALIAYGIFMLREQWESADANRIA
jgi:prolipoprotein diacylglyceryltransferase